MKSSVHTDAMLLNMYRMSQKMLQAVLRLGFYLLFYNDSIVVVAVSEADVLCPRRIQGAGGKFGIRICSIIVTAIGYMAS